MKRIYYYLGAAAVMMFTLFSCSKNGSDVISNTNNYPKTPANYVTGTDLTGTLKGTLKQGQTYNLTGDVVVNQHDTLAVESGVTVIAKGNYHFVIYGTFLSLGTDASPVTFTTDNPNKLTDLGVKGYWGGFLIDSLSLYDYVRFTHINFTGGPDSGGSAQTAFDVEGSQSYNGGAHIVFEDNWLFGSIDNGMLLYGNITVSVKRNVFQRLGGPDGETINIKSGVAGDISYNYIWSAANNGIKLETNDQVYSPQTNLNIYNNTIINGGWRKVGEFTNGILIDVYAAANIYNNIIVANHAGINITDQADTVHCHYGNNLIYAIADSVSQFIYPTGSFGKPQSSDLIGTGTSLCSSVFTTWAPGILADQTMQDNDVPTLKSGSPAIGKGITTAPFTYWTTDTSNKYGTVDKVNKDLGAYPTDGSGNKHLPTPQPAM